MSLLCGQNQVHRRWTSWISNSTLVLVTCLMGLVTGCVTNAPIKDVGLSYPTIRKAVLANLPGGFRKQSENGRELDSQYFDPKNWDTAAPNKPERAYAHVVILGSSRPFDLDVHVYLEEKDQESHAYSRVGEDEGLTDKLIEKLRKTLADRREDRNVIDDFRAF